MVRFAVQASNVSVEALNQRHKGQVRLSLRIRLRFASVLIDLLNSFSLKYFINKQKAEVA